MKIVDTGIPDQVMTATCRGCRKVVAAVMVSSNSGIRGSDKSVAELTASAAKSGDVIAIVDGPVRVDLSGCVCKTAIGR